MVKFLLLCRLFNSVLLCSVCGYRYSVWRTKSCVWRCVHDWSRWREIFLPHMDVVIVFGSALYSSLLFVWTSFYNLFWAVCILDS
jgi:hypothetical protein